MAQPGVEFRSNHTLQLLSLYNCFLVLQSRSGWWWAGEIREGKRLILKKVLRLWRCYWQYQKNISKRWIKTALKKSLFISPYELFFLYRIHWKCTMKVVKSGFRTRMKSPFCGNTGPHEGQAQHFRYKKCFFKWLWVEFYFWKQRSVLQNCAISPLGQWASEIKLLLSLNKFPFYVKTFTFRVLNCSNWATGFSVFLPIKFWISCLMLTSARQEAPTEQHTVQGFNSLSSSRPVCSWPKCLSILSCPLQEELSIHMSRWQGCQHAALCNTKEPQGLPDHKDSLSEIPFKCNGNGNELYLGNSSLASLLQSNPNLEKKRIRTSFAHYFHNVINYFCT